jgi:threonine/homoserine/homoserine lactone efflux protein
VRNTLVRGWRGGFAAAGGAATGNTIQATVAGAGVAVLFARYPAAGTALRVAGGAYLLWLGLVSLKKAVRRNSSRMNFRGTEAGENSSGKSFAGKSFRQGLTVNLLNPAITTFYVAVVPTFVPAGAPGWYYAFLAALHVVLAFICHSMWTVAFDRLRRWMEGPAVARVLDVATAGVLITLAVKVLAD